MIRSLFKLTLSFRIWQRGRPPPTDDSFASASAKCFPSHQRRFRSRIIILCHSHHLRRRPTCTSSSLSHSQHSHKYVKNFKLSLPSFWMAHRSRKRPELTLQYYCCCLRRRPTSPSHTQQLNSTFRSTAVQATFAGGEPCTVVQWTAGDGRRMAAECAT